MMSRFQRYLDLIEMHTGEAPYTCDMCVLSILEQRSKKCMSVYIHVTLEYAPTKQVFCERQIT